MRLVSVVWDRRLHPCLAILGMGCRSLPSPPAIQGETFIDRGRLYLHALGSLIAILSMSDTRYRIQPRDLVVGGKCWFRSNEAHSASRLRCDRPAGVVGDDGGLRHLSRMNTSRKVPDGGSQGAHFAEIYVPHRCCSARWGRTGCLSLLAPQPLTSCADNGYRCTPA